MHPLNLQTLRLRIDQMIRGFDAEVLKRLFEKHQKFRKLNFDREKINENFLQHALYEPLKVHSKQNVIWGTLLKAINNRLVRKIRESLRDGKFSNDLKSFMFEISGFIENPKNLSHFILHI